MILNSKYNFLCPYKVKNLIRIGREFDGGYLVCENSLKHVENLITLGVGDDTSFERDLNDRLKLNKILLFDYTINNYLFVKIILKYFRRFITFRSPLKNLTYSIKNFFDYLNFIKKTNVNLFKSRVVSQIKEKIDINLKKIFEMNLNEKNFLKIDIEGSEYEIIEDIIDHSQKISVLIIEFHWINKQNDKFIDSVKKLKEKFDLIHIHPNNYKQIQKDENFFDVVELSFVNKSINSFNNEKRYDFPIDGLDFDCFPNHKSFIFSFQKD